MSPSGKVYSQGLVGVTAEVGHAEAGEQLFGLEAELRLQAHVEPGTDERGIM